ncbi:MAG: ATP-binding protein [Terracidiphilus sp.]|jgi:predicted ATPase
MPNSNEIRRLTAKWNSKGGWPKKLEWIKISGLRGWKGHAFRFDYPIMAIVGENGAGKSTVLQCAAAIYRSTAPKTFLKGRGFASDYFPNTAWDSIKSAGIEYCVWENDSRYVDTIHRPGQRWRGNLERRDRPVVYIDLSRILPVSARVGYSKIAKTPHKELRSQPFDKQRLSRFNSIMGRSYASTKFAYADIDETRPIPVMEQEGASYSGFHGGAGETTVAELIQTDLPKYSLVLIDEIETSLHPRLQRRLIRDLADKCREQELQILLTTHSPFILEELPYEARAQIMQTLNGRTIVYGVSPEFAMTKMDEVPQYDCDVFVEDKRAQIFLTEILAKYAPTLALCCRTVPYGAASVGQALGIMASQQRFYRPSCVFLDGDQANATGCTNLPGGDAPEQVVFTNLRDRNWCSAAARVGRPYADFSDACSRAMTITDHHEWVGAAATTLVLGGDGLWQALCAEWAANCISEVEIRNLIRPIEDAKIGAPFVAQPTNPVPIEISMGPFDANGNPLLF